MIANRISEDKVEFSGTRAEMKKLRKIFAARGMAYEAPHLWAVTACIAGQDDIKADLPDVDQRKVLRLV